MSEIYTCSNCHEEQPATSFVTDIESGTMEEFMMCEECYDMSEPPELHE